MAALELLKDFLGNAAFQMRVRGDMARRLSYLSGYYGLLGLHRLRGGSHSAGQEYALKKLSARKSFRKTVLVDYGGAKMELDPLSACSLLKEFQADGEYAHFPAFIPKPGWTVVDVGAHQGLYARMAASQVGSGGRVVAVEPHSGNREILLRNISRNRLGHVIVTGKALSDSPGAGELFIHPTASMLHSLVVRYGNAAALPVEVETLDRLLADLEIGRVDLIKIDVEGAHFDVLKGSVKTLSSLRPKLVLEVERKFQFDGRERIKDFLRRFDYRVCEAPPLLYAEPVSFRAPSRALTSEF